jgi:hypothetical protein
VTDAGVCIGLDKDFSLIKDGNSDRWENEFRSNIEGKFEEGKVINDYVSINCIPTGGAIAGRVEVQGRRKLSFIRGKGDIFSLYRRQGNRSVEIAINEIEEFLQFRAAKGW